MINSKEYLYLKRNLWSLNCKNYNEYLRSTIWKWKKSFMLSKFPTCKKCGKKKFLQVHHLTYKRLGREKSKDLMVLCNECHGGKHGKRIN